MFSRAEPNFNVPGITEVLLPFASDCCYVLSLRKLAQRSFDSDMTTELFFKLIHVNGVLPSYWK